jgi:hypothetical protein
MTASTYLELGAYTRNPFECSETLKGASYDERWLSLKRSLFLFLAGWLAGIIEPSISNLYLSPVHHDEQKALATTGTLRILPQLGQKLTAMVQEMVQVGPYHISSKKPCVKRTVGLWPQDGNDHGVNSC